MSTKRIKSKSKQTARYIPLEDIKTIDDAFLNEINNVRIKLSGCDDENFINAFSEVLRNGYKAAIELKALEREVDYDIKFAEIEARADELRPVRRCWLWRLLFRPLTNRAQDIIEERAEFDADKAHEAAEKAIKDEREKLLQDSVEIKSKRELRRELKKQLKAAIKKADETPTNEAFDEPAAPTPAPMHDIELEQAQPQPAPTNDDYATLTDKAAAALLKKVQPAKQLAGQMTLDDVQPQENAAKPAQVELQVSTRRPRPPRSCRK